MAVEAVRVRFPLRVQNLMHFTYALLSCSKKYIYAGKSSNLKDRIRRHNAGYEKATRPYRPFILLYWELLDDQVEAHRREIFLKSRFGKRFLYKIVHENKSKLGREGPSSWLYDTEDSVSTKRQLLNNIAHYLAL